MNSLTEPCEPYKIRSDLSSAVSLDEIIDRLPEWQVRRLAVSLAIFRPDVFEERILNFAAGRLM